MVLHGELDHQQPVQVHQDEVVDGCGGRDDVHTGRYITELYAKGPP